jgi:Flp pilus assembly protein TadB
MEVANFSFNVIFALVCIGLGGCAAGYLIYKIVQNRNQKDLKNLMYRSNVDHNVKAGIKKLDPSEKKSVVNEEELKRLESEHKKGGIKKKGALTEEERYCKAGMFAKSERDSFKRFRFILSLFLGGIFCAGFYKMVGIELGLVLGLLGMFVGYATIPSMVLDGKIKKRDEDIMYFLPLVIEQIAIGVSSSLDVGPCLSMVVKMADERNSHNPVTELIKHTQFYVKSGASLQEALIEVGEMSGHTELNHTFIALAQVAKHGGEITRQMQDLADAVSAQRETKVEERVRTLELKATGPVALVFIGFMIILIVSLGLQLKELGHQKPESNQKVDEKV